MPRARRRGENAPPGGHAATSLVLRGPTLLHSVTRVWQHVDQLLTICNKRSHCTGRCHQQTPPCSSSEEEPPLTRLSRKASPSELGPCSLRSTSATPDNSPHSAGYRHRRSGCPALQRPSLFLKTLCASPTPDHPIPVPGKSAPICDEFPQVHIAPTSPQHPQWSPGSRARAGGPSRAGCPSPKPLGKDTKRCEVSTSPTRN